MFGLFRSGYHLAMIAMRSWRCQESWSGSTFHPALRSILRAFLGTAPFQVTKRTSVSLPLSRASFMAFSISDSKEAVKSSSSLFSASFWILLRSVKTNVVMCSLPFFPLLCVQIHPILRIFKQHNIVLCFNYSIFQLFCQKERFGKLWDV